MAKVNTKEVIKAADSLSLGISMVVAVLIGVGLGLMLSHYLEIPWLLWVGVFIGVAASFLNVYKAYKEQVKSLDELKDDPRYKDYKADYDEDDDDA